jgi:hypothetical protein
MWIIRNNYILKLCTSRTLKFGFHQKGTRDFWDVMNDQHCLNRSFQIIAHLGEVGLKLR